MSDVQNDRFAINRFRISVLAWACILGLLAAWILVAELLRPKGIEFTVDAQLAASVYARRNGALEAARAGVVRGDLWSGAAFAYGGSLWSEDKQRPPFDQIITVTERAIRYAPHNSRLWLLLAASYGQFDGLNERSASFLRMSYYTGSNSMAVVAERLLLAAQSRSLRDDDFQELVRRDIQIAATHKSQLTPALIGAYERAPATGKQFIEKVLDEFNPSLLATIRAETKHQ